MFGLRNFFTIVCACCLFGQSRTAGDLNSNPGWVRVRALIEQHSLQSHSDRIAAVWTATGGEDCKKALMGAGIKKDAATEICSTDNPERSKKGSAQESVLAGADLTGRGEVVGSGGGVWLSDGGGTHGLFGGSVGVGASSKALVFFDVYYAPLESAHLSLVAPGAGITVGGRAKLLDLAGGLKYSLPGANSGKTVPYVVLAMGVGRASVSGTGTVRQGNQTVTVNISESASNFAVHGGIGVRLYVGKKWGIQPEFRFGHYFAEGGGGNAARFTAGVFYQFGK